MQTRICTKCKIEKEFSQFPRNENYKFGIGYTCKLCQNIYAKKYRKLNKEKISQISKKYYEKNKEERKKIQRKYYQENKEYRHEFDKKYYQEHKEERKKYCKENRLKINEYENKKYYTDINFQIAMKLRKRFYSVLKNNYKHGSAVKMLGCSIEEFKMYFESLFTEGMTWEKVNSGEIHIDHKRPLANFDLSIPENQATACHYSNLQPLWAVDNLKKSDKWEV